MTSVRVKSLIGGADRHTARDYRTEDIKKTGGWMARAIGA